jgi:hypothetical protein
MSRHEFLEQVVSADVAEVHFQCVAVRHPGDVITDGPGDAVLFNPQAITLGNLGGMVVVETEEVLKDLAGPLVYFTDILVVVKISGRENPAGSGPGHAF